MPTPLFEDLVSAAQLTHLAFQLTDPLLLLAGHAWPLAAVDLGLADPLAQRLGRADPQLAGDRPHRLPLRVVLVAVLQHHPHRPLPQLAGIPRRS
jgi:hypothetical protein